VGFQQLSSERDTLETSHHAPCKVPVVQISFHALVEELVLLLRMEWGLSGK
jgi:hypothetical protein